MYKGLKDKLAEFLSITIGAIIMGTALSLFLVPYKIAPGGMSGLATVIYYVTGIRVSTLLILINAPLLLLGLLRFKAGFLVKSVYGTVVLSVATEIMSGVSMPVSDTLLVSVAGGAILGFGIAVVLRTGGTTGGTDIIVLLLRKFLPTLSVGQLFLTIDGVIIVIAGAVFKSPETILYSAAALFVSSRVTDAVLEGVNFAKLIYIVSEKPKEITEQIYSGIDRGVTGLNSVSMYTGKNGVTLLCVIRRYQLPKLKKLIYETDPSAFVIVSDAREVTGNGFGTHRI